MLNVRTAQMLAEPAPAAPRPSLRVVADRLGPLPFVTPAPGSASGTVRQLPAACDVLVVDDDPSILATVSEILRDEGIEVATASNGEEALSILQHVRPWVVLLDMRMPVMDGWAFARAAREQGLQVPIVVMTAAQDARRWAAEIEANGYLSKPFDLGDLLKAVDRFRLEK